MTMNDLTLQTEHPPTEQPGEGDTDVLEAKPKQKLQRPSFYKVVLLNDDFTPMDFVVKVLESIYHKSTEEAASIMMQVHQKGAGLCGVFTRDVAETKVDQTLYLARQNDHPLQCVMEKDA
ncbi:MAG: ATP-dependent Clp protease adapter ClpS [Rickettsiales bacterium]|nr:ATP-dependent Clp protease adapter ClpS [Rickettsiales bacterium]